MRCFHSACQRSVFLTTTDTAVRMYRGRDLEYPVGWRHQAELPLLEIVGRASLTVKLSGAH